MFYEARKDKECLVERGRDFCKSKQFLQNYESHVLKSNNYTVSGVAHKATRHYLVLPDGCIYRAATL